MKTYFSLFTAFSLVLPLAAAPLPHMVATDNEISWTPLPLSRKSGPQWQKSLDGIWKFSPQSPEQTGTVDAKSTATWTDIEVPGQWRKDVALFRDANVNLIRTCHYPSVLSKEEAWV